MANDIKLDLNIDKDAIERAIVDAVVASSLGKKISEEVNRMGQDYKVTQIIGEAIHSRIRQTIFELLDTPENRDRIRTIANSMLTDEVLNEIALKGLKELKIDRW
jgi:hypothetical protein